MLLNACALFLFEKIKVYTKITYTGRVYLKVVDNFFSNSSPLKLPQNQNLGGGAIMYFMCIHHVNTCEIHMSANCKYSRWTGHTKEPLFWPLTFLCSFILLDFRGGSIIAPPPPPPLQSFPFFNPYRNRVNMFDRQILTFSNYGTPGMYVSYHVNYSNYSSQWIKINFFTFNVF